jgi:putative nucleotidyltransferase with HDIG domain
MPQHVPENLLGDFTKTFLAMMEEKDASLRSHCERVAGSCASFCEAYKLLGEEEIEAIYVAGLLHDIGLIYVPLSILERRNELSDDELPLLKKHPLVGEKILKPIDQAAKALPIIRHHHEAFDGSGYPDGLKGGQIPLGARILCLFNNFDILINPHPKNEGLPLEAALAHIKNASDNLFDGSLVAKFIEFIESSFEVPADIIENNDKASTKEIFREILKRFKLGKIEPPVMPQVFMEVQNFVHQPESGMDDLIKIIEKDPVLSLRLISVANSPVYRGVQKIESLKIAVARLGLKETLNMVFAIGIKSIYETKSAQFRILMNELWLHALACGYCAKLIAERLKLENSEKYFLLGLIHDIGKALLLNAFSEVSQGKQMDPDTVRASLLKAHLSLGAGLLKRWRFGNEFIDVVSYHENTDLTADTSKEILVTHLANILTRNIGYSLYNDEIDMAAPDSAKILQIEPSALHFIGEETKKIIVELESVL